MYCTLLGIYISDVISRHYTDVVPDLSASVTDNSIQLCPNPGSSGPQSRVLCRAISLLYTDYSTFTNSFIVGIFIICNLFYFVFFVILYILFVFSKWLIGAE